MTDDELLATYANQITADEFWIRRPVDHFTRAGALQIIKMCQDLGLYPDDNVVIGMIVALYERVVALETP